MAEKMRPRGKDPGCLHSVSGDRKFIFAFRESSPCRLERSSIRHEAGTGCAMEGSGEILWITGFQQFPFSLISDLGQAVYAAIRIPPIFHGHTIFNVK